MPIEPSLNRSPFHAFHLEHGATMVGFAGWQMPLHYGSVIEEHQRCRQRGAMFDVSHMGRFTLRGIDARRALETLLTRRVSDMVPGQVRYSLVCHEAGGVLDDVLVSRHDEHWSLVVNASNSDKLLAHFTEIIQADFPRTTLQDVTSETAMIALQGPAVMGKLAGFSRAVAQLKRYRFAEIETGGAVLIVSRTGYTGEDGVEVIMPVSMVSTAIQTLLEDDPDQVALPAGLGARDTLRTEAGMPLYGHELNESINPLEAGLGFAVDLTKGETVEKGPVVPRFVGQGALQEVKTQGPKRQLVGLVLEGKRTPRQGAAVLLDGQEVGALTSGCASPTLGQPIAMAMVEGQAVEPTGVWAVDLRGKALPAERVALPFYKRG